MIPVFHFLSYYTSFTPRPKSSFPHLERGIQDFHFDTNAYKLQTSLWERVVVDGHGCNTALHFGVKVEENQDKFPTLYRLPKLHKIPIKQHLLLILVIVRQ